TADDVVFTYQAIKTWKSPLLNNFRNVNVLRVDDQTIQFQLPKANPSFLNLLTVGIMPAHIWEDLSDVNAMLTDANLKPIGSGPYQALSFTRDSKGFIFSYHLRAWPKYYGIAPFIKDVTFRFYGDRVQAQNALRGNQVDTLAFVPWGDVATIKNKNVHSLKLELPQETVAFFNTKDAVLKDERLRTALSMAIDHHELQDLIGAHATLINSPFPFLEATTSTPENLEGARALLQSMGWILNAGETVRHFVPVVVPKSTKKTASVTTSSTPLTLTIDVPEQPDLLKVADFLKRRWSLLGIQVAIQSTDPESLLRQILNDRSYQIVVWNILLPETQDLTPFWNSGSATGNGLNLSNLQDRDVDNALNALNNVTSTEGLLSARLRLANTILARVPALFLLRPAYAYMVSNRVLGTSDERISRPADRLRNMNTWYIKTDLRWK
ncbi:ABC transporter substrate-binding protein, partial [Candidatus Uhrbacteria bacterium]|nr:ABC transporter substrate-binding protein [Candidatus Uhrbacteria bacterium]